MEIIRVDVVEGFINERRIKAKQLLKNDDVQIMNLILKPGEVVPEHSVPVYAAMGVVVFYI